MAVDEELKGYKIGFKKVKEERGRKKQQLKLQKVRRKSETQSI